MEINELEEQLDEQGVHVKTGINILFLDVSSTCTGYSIYCVDFVKKKANMITCGGLWFGNDWKHGRKYHYIYNALVVYFDIVCAIDHIVHESYSINPRKMQGVQVLPEMIGAIRTAAFEVGIKQIGNITPQTWRSQLKIKATKNEKGEKDYKIPTKNKILEFVDVPEQTISNITGTSRRTPFDIYDAIAIGAGWLTKYGFDIKFQDVTFNEHIGNPNL